MIEDEDVFGPASEKQALFLQSEAKIVVYGGKLVPPFKTHLIR